MSEQYALFGFNPQMWYKDIGNSEVEICEILDATIWTLHTGETEFDLAKRLIDKYKDQSPVVINAMLVPVEDKMVRVVEAVDKRAKRDWTHLYEILGEDRPSVYPHK